MFFQLLCFLFCFPTLSITYYEDIFENYLYIFSYYYWSEKKRSPRGVPQNGSPKKFKEKSNNNLYDLLSFCQVANSLEMIPSQVKLVVSFREILQSSYCKNICTPFLETFLLKVSNRNTKKGVKLLKINQKDSILSLSLFSCLYC